MSHLDALVVGGGISGLSVAHCLARAGLEVEVWESADRVGGKIRSDLRDGYRLESAASMVVNFRSELDSFVRSVGLEGRMRARAPMDARYLLDGDRLKRAPGGVGDLLRTPLLSARGKLRMLAEPFAPRGRDPHESVAAFVTRRLGREVLDKLFEPYVAGPLASDAALAEARSAMPKLAALEKRYGSLALGALLKGAGRRGGASRAQAFSFDGGMATLPECLAAAGGFRVRRGLRVREVWPVRGGWMARGTNGASAAQVSCGHLILSTPPDAAAEMLRDADATLARMLLGIGFSPIKIVHAGFRRSRVRHGLDGSGFLVPRESAFAANGCLWISRIFPAHAPQDRVLLTSYLGGARRPEAAGWDTERSASVVLGMLRALLGAEGEPDLLHVETHERGLPLYHGAYSALVEAMDRRLGRLPGLHLAANYKGGVSVRDRITCAERLALGILRCAGRATQRAGLAARRPAAAREIVPATAVGL